ncbi:MAG: hypothetical protein C0467_22465 [Planctomycetaceae bacterium]|nr:hypothetical protein [Planctomycetaceae bacterium]
MRWFSIALLAVCTLTGQVRADEKTDADEVKKVVETYLKNQASPTRCDDNLALCLGDAVHLVMHRKDDKLDVPRTVKQLNEYIKGVLKEDQRLKIESVKVDVKGGTGLAVAFASFTADETSCYSVFTLSKRGDQWKVASVTQENRR